MIKKVLLTLMSVLLLPIPADAGMSRQPGSHMQTSHKKRLNKSRQKSISNRRNRNKIAVSQKAKKTVKAKPQAQTGVLFMNEAGETLVDQLSDIEFNPASVAKLITAYGAIKSFGLEHRFSTKVSSSGLIDEKSGTLNGDLYIEGMDPDFERDDACRLKNGLLQMGIKKISGKVLVSGKFSYASVANAAYSARCLQKIFQQPVAGQLILSKGCSVAETPETAVQLFQQESETLQQTLKEMLSYSQNGVAEQIGRVSGGLKTIQNLVQEEAGLAPGSLKLASASGLGRGRVKPKHMMLVLKALRAELQQAGLDLQDICPVAGIDPGTLDERFTASAERGSVIGKTGTLPGTDGGTSSLVGMFRTREENIYFVIFCWRGNVPQFRKQQDNLIRNYQAAHGGAAPFEYIQANAF